MADVVPISGGPEQAKIRSVFAPALLPIITLGIYALVWWYKINREMADLGRKNGTTELGTNPTLSLLALFPGGLLIIPAIWTTVTTWGRLKRAQALAGIPETERGNGFLAGLLYVFISIVFYGYVQNELNKVWRRQPGAGLSTSSSPMFTTTATTTATSAADATPATPAETSGSALPGVPGSGGAEPSSPTNLPGIPGE